MVKRGKARHFFHPYSWLWYARFKTRPRDVNGVGCGWIMATPPLRGEETLHKMGRGWSGARGVRDILSYIIWLLQHYWFNKREMRKLFSSPILTWIVGPIMNLISETVYRVRSRWENTVCVCVCTEWWQNGKIRGRAIKQNPSSSRPVPYPLWGGENSRGAEKAMHFWGL